MTVIAGSDADRDPDSYCPICGRASIFVTDHDWIWSVCDAQIERNLVEQQRIYADYQTVPGGQKYGDLDLGLGRWESDDLPS